MPERSAHASIRGYFAQLARTAVEWARLPANELLVVEGDEDFDRQLRDGDQLVSTILHQHKTTSSRIGWSSDVQKSVLGFVASFAVHHSNGVTCRPMYVATSEMADVEILRQWTSTTRSQEELTHLATQVASDLRAHPLLREGSAFATAAKKGVEYLDVDQSRWTTFVESTRWSFGAPDHDEDLKQLALLLQGDNDATGLPLDNLALRIVVALFEVAMEPDIKTRTLRRQDLTSVILRQRNELAEWAAGPQARAFFDALDLDTLLAESRQLIELEFRRGAIDRQGGPRAPRLGPETKLRANDAALLRMVIGERGAGKTSLVAKWASDELAGGRSVAWLRCRTRSESVEAFFRERGCRRGSVVLEMFERHNVTLVLDALDQGREQTTLAALCELVERATTIGLRTIAVVRLQHADSHSDVQRLLAQAIRIDVEKFSDDELRTIAGGPNAPPNLNALLDSLAAALPELTRLPLHVHFAWALAGSVSSFDPRSVTTLAGLLEHYWNQVVKLDGEAINADDALLPLLEAMLRERRLTSRIGGSGRDTILRLVRAEVLQHPSVSGFGPNDGEVSFALDAVFDFAVFRLLWRNATGPEVIASLSTSGTFAAGLDRSFRYLLEYREAQLGVRIALELASAAFVASGVDAAAKEMIAAEVADWLAADAARAGAIASSLSSVGVPELVSRLTTVTLRDP